MKDAFPSIVDINFTATMEKLLDGVEEGNIDWKTVIANFYPDLDEAVNQAEKDLEQVEIKDEESDVECDKCGRKMVGVPCPKCNKELVIRKTKKGRRYYGCESYPECDFMSWAMPVNEKCPNCGNILVKKGNKLCCIDEQCGYVTVVKKEDKE